MEDAPEPDPDFEPVTFDLAKGTKVRVAIGKYWEQISATDRALGIQPTLYLAIRIYSDEDTYPRRLTHHDEFRAKHDFAPSVLQRLHLWLADLAVSRHRFVYDSVEDFLEEFATSMDEFSAMGEDLADRFHKTLGTKTPPPYEDPVHADFPEDEFVSAKRDAEEEVEEADEAVTAEGGTVLDTDGDGSENEGGTESDDELPAGTDDPDEVETDDEDGGETDDETDDEDEDRGP
jgi:hypothetical protein